jgi:hypothetical protein
MRHSSFIDNRYSGCGRNAWRKSHALHHLYLIILAAMLVAKTVSLPRGATASHNETNDTMNVR